MSIILPRRERNMTNKEKIRQNVVDFAKAKQKIKSRINDKDINALFLGLAGIVKKNAMEQVSSELKKECKVANQNFRQTLMDLNKAESTVRSLEMENMSLKDKIELQQKQICYLVKKMYGGALSTTS